MAVLYAKKRGAKTLSICYTNRSTIPRESDGVLYTHAGSDIAVVSGKVFLAQVTAAYLLRLYLAQLRGNKFEGDIKDMVAGLGKIQRILDNEGQLGRSIAAVRSVLFLCRHVGVPMAMEGALQLKEIAYVHPCQRLGRWRA